MEYNSEKHKKHMADLLNAKQASCNKNNRMPAQIIWLNRRPLRLCLN